MLRLLLVSPMVLVLGSCTLDTELPRPPPLGAITGSVDTQGKVPPEGVAVALIATTGARQATVTTAGGRFDFAQVVNGQYFLEVKQPGFATLVVPGVVVRGGETYDAGVLQPVWLTTTKSAGTIQGRVTSSSGTIPVGGKVEFLVGSSKSLVSSAAIDFAGDFSALIPPGDYTLRASHPFFVTKEVTATVEENRVTTLPMPIVLDIDPATLSGRVLVEASTDGQPPAPRSGVTITVDTGASAVTDAMGQFTVTGLPAGARTFRVTLADFDDPTPERSVTLEPAKTKVLGDIVLERQRGSLTGEVELADGKKLSDVTVVAAVLGTPYASSVAGSASAQSRGRFVINRVPVGTYTVRASSSGYASADQTSVRVEAGRTVDVGLLRLAALSGNFRIEDADPSNTPGYTRSRNVTLDFSQFLGAVRVRFAENDPGLTSATFQSVSPSPIAFSLSAGEGTKIIYAQYETATGTQSAVQAAAIVVDTRAPQLAALTLEGGKAFSANRTLLGLTAVAVDEPAMGVDVASGLAFMRLSPSAMVDTNGHLSGPREAYTRERSWTPPSPLGEGPFTLHVQFIDNAGNVSAPVNDAIVIDTLAPSGGITVARGARAASNGFTDEVAVILNAMATSEPNGGSVQVRLANAAQDVATAVLRPVEANLGWFLDPVNDGLKTVHYQFVDAAGNASGVQTATVTLDRQAPTPAAVSLPASEPDALFDTRSIPLQLQASDVNGLTHATAVTVSMSATFTDATTTTPAPFPMSSSLTYQVPAGDGAKTIYVRYRDVAGNEALASLTVTLDQTPPTADLVLAGTLADGASVTGSPTAGPTVAGLTATVLFQNPSGITEVLVLPGAVSCAGTWSAFTSTQVTTPLAMGNGTRQVTVCLRDAAGNVTGPLVRSLTLDTLAPTCTVGLTGVRADGSTTLPLPAGQTGRPTVTVTFSCGMEAPTEVAVVQGAVTCVPNAPLAWVPYRPSLAFALTGADGATSVTACVRDLARNTGATNAPTITLDTTPPSGVITLHTGKAFFNRADFLAIAPMPAVDMAVDVAAQGATEWAISESTTPASFTFTNPARYRASSNVDGVRTVYALFRDAVGNVSSLVSDVIEVDITVPAATNGDLAIANVNLLNYLNQRVAAVEVRARADASTIRLAQAALAGGCAATDVQNEVPRAASGTYTVQLTGPEGLKRICAEYVDAAGNASALISRTLTLDTTPPTAPASVTQGAVLAVPDDAPFFVDTTNANDANPFVYEVRGGKQGGWVGATPSVAPSGANRFTFHLDVKPGDEEGTLNVLRVRARDEADNLSDEAVVTVVGDSNLPDFNDTNVPNLVGQTPWVDNGDRRSTFHWKKSSSPDVTGYLVEYGSDTSSMTGSFASEGISPIRVGDVSSFTLSGLPNEAPTYVRVRPVDRAGNVGPFAPTSVSNAVVLQPNAVSLNFIGSHSFPLGTRISRLAVAGDHLFVTATRAMTNDHCSSAPPSPVNTQLHVLPLATLRSAVQNGVPQDAGIPAVGYSSAEFADGTLCVNFQYPSDLLVDGIYAFMSSGTRVRVFDISRPLSPVLEGVLDFGPLAPAMPWNDTFQVRSVQVTGDRLVAAGNGYVAVVSLAELYDGNAATFPTVTGAGNDLFAFRRLANPPSNSGDFITLTRDRLLQVSTTGALTSVWDLGDALDSSAFTIFDASDELGASGSRAAATRSPVGGNYLFQGTRSGGFQVLNLSSAWTATPAADFPTIATTGYFAAGQLGLGGNQVFLGDGTQDLQVLDLSDVFNITRNAFVRSFSASNVELYGNYVITAHHEAVGFYEAATPRSMRVRDSIFDTGFAPALANGLLMTTGGVVVDTMSSGMRVWPNEVGTSECSTGSAFWPEGEVMANGTGVRVRNLVPQLDRSGALNPVAGDGVNIALAGSGRITDVELVGNQLVAVEVRADGVYLEVFRATNLRDVYPSTLLSASDSRASFRFSATVPPAGTLATLTVTNGRAFVGLDYSTVGQNNVFVVDVRPMLDDLPTSMAASNVLGAYRLASGVLGVSAQGTQVYACTQSGGVSFDLASALLDPPSQVAVLPVTRALSASSCNEVVTYGSYAFLVGAATQAGLLAVDVSTPSSPVPLSAIPGPGLTHTCTPAQDSGFKTRRAGVVVRGSRAWMNFGPGIREIELE